MNKITSTPLQIPSLKVAFETADYQKNIYQYFADFHASTPVFSTPDGVIYLTRFADCQNLLKGKHFSRRPVTGPSVFSNEAREQNAFEEILNDWMVYQDPPQHTRLRTQLNQIFLPTRISIMEDDIRSIATSLLNEFRDNETIEFVSRFAYLMPISVICAMLHVDEKDYEQFRLWSRDLTAALNTGSDEDIALGIAAANALKDYFMRHLDQKFERGGDDILNALLKATDARELSLEEAANVCVFMIWAGHETTKLLIANGLLLLIQHPEQLQKLRARPELLNSAIEEMLRYESPIQKISRWTREDTMFSDYLVPANTLVTAILGAAHRDPDEFDQPHRFLIERIPNRHLAFGSGIHHCLGVYLARLEARIAFEEILKRCRNISLVDYHWRPLSAFRSLDKLELIIEP